VGRSCLLVTWAGGGNVNPFLGLARHLITRGYRVGAVATGSLLPRLEGAGIVACGAADGWLPGPEDVDRAIDAFAPDVVVVDYMLTGALCQAERSGLPTVALVHTLYAALLREGAPFPMAMTGPLPVVNDLRRRLGLEPLDALADLLSACGLVLVAAPRQLDEDGPVPANLVYAGALFEGAGDDAGWEPPPGTGPLVAVSVGTAGEPGNETELLHRVTAALGQLPVRGLVTLPDYIDPGALRPPANVALSGYVRHAALLPHASVLVTHAGLGSVVAALAHGVPMVCVPLGRDQPDNAAAVVRVGAGVSLPVDAPVDALSSAIDAQLRAGTSVRIPPDPEHALDRLDALVTDRP
jgi:UDP:flavonoid glycosyltransferase YjiC (YdhE family)